ATYRFLVSLRPIALDLGCHINLETHEEITSFELVRLVERVGPDVCGIVFDTANLLQRLEHPAWTTRRVAPYVRQTQLKDATVRIDGDGSYRFELVPCGDGLVDFDLVLRELADSPTTVTLTIENLESSLDFPGPAPVTRMPLDDPEFVAGHPDLSLAELAAYVALVNRHARAEAPGAGAEGPGSADAMAALLRSREHLTERREALADARRAAAC
ncbi:MAG: TIM barrel protein, partial [Nocardioides sp.]|uniref:sugar phosphate isomerase/epimerase family protein n=1 Tax=Nocardioides sp. TaxID=35761 RepID=UPI0039E6D60C